MIEGEEDLHQLGKAFLVVPELLKSNTTGCKITLETHPSVSQYEDKCTYIELMQHLLHMRAHHAFHQAAKTVKAKETTAASRLGEYDPATEKKQYIYAANLTTEIGIPTDYVEAQTSLGKSGPHGFEAQLKKMKSKDTT